MADGPRYFDPRTEISPLRGDFFPTSSSSGRYKGSESYKNYDGLTGFQQNFLTSAFVSRVLPLQQELQALEERRKKSQFDDLRLEEQNLQLEVLREQTKNNRDILTRIPTLMQDLDAVLSTSDQDPEGAALKMLQLETKNAEVIAANASARVAVEAAQRNLGYKIEKQKQAEAEKKARELATIGRVEKFAQTGDPTLMKRAETLASGIQGPMAAQAAQALEDSTLIAGAAKRQAAKQQAEKAVQAQFQWLDEAKKFLEGIESDTIEDLDPRTGKTVVSYKFAPETEELVNRLAANIPPLPGESPETDILRKRNQILARIDQEKLRLLMPVDPDTVSSTPSTMRDSTPSR